MSLTVHPTALVDPGAVLGEGTVVGPHAFVGPGVTTGSGCRIGIRAVLERNVRLGHEVELGVGVVLGGDPQDLKFGGEDTWVEIGDRTRIRDYSTVNRGTAASGITRVGADVFLMSYVHVAHDCVVGDGVMIANATQLAGHVTIHERAILSGLVAVHQFVTIGTMAFIGGASRVPQDIPPFIKAVGNPIELYGLNSVGLRRAGYSRDSIMALKRAYRICFNSDIPLGQALDRARAECPPLPEVDLLLGFLSRSQRGVPA